MSVAGSTMNIPALRATPTSSSLTALDASRISHYSTKLTCAIAFLVPFVAVIYIVIFSRAYRRAEPNIKALNKASSRVVGRYALRVYLYIFCLSIFEVAFASWLLLQYRFNKNYPLVEAQTGTATLLFSACWTTITSGVYAILFIHPTLSAHPVSSVGAQTLWVFVTWLLWIISSGMINASFPSALAKGSCDSVVYCRQIQWMFGFSVAQTLSLTVALGVLAWVAWEATRSVVQKEEASAE